MICKKNKAFTLIELLVVVAIIGILAAVGVNTFSGFQENAKAAATKSNLAYIKKYIILELSKCDLGETIVMDGYLTCADIGTENVADIAFKSLKLKHNFNYNNPYGDPVGRRTGPGRYPEAGIGLGNGNNDCNGKGPLGRTAIYENPLGKIEFETCAKLNDPIIKSYIIY